MSRRDELQELWQSQPEQGGVPKFGLVDDLAAPVHFPLAAGSRYLGAAVFAYWIWFFGRQIESSGPVAHVAAVWMGLIAAVSGVILFLVQREFPVDSPGRESIAQFRHRLAREYERQSKIQTWIYLATFVPIVAATVTLEYAGGSPSIVLLLALLFCAGALWLAVAKTRRANAAAVRKLRDGV